MQAHDKASPTGRRKASPGGRGGLSKSTKSARELICKQVAEEFNSRFESDQLPRSQILNLENPRFANLNFMRQSALEGFRRGEYTVTVDGLEVKDLDDTFPIRPDTKVVFRKNKNFPTV